MSEEQEKDTPGISRRKFVTTVAATGAALTIVPRHVLGRGFQAPSDTLNIATVGINGQGFTNTRNLMGENIVAICDVDYTLLDSALARAKAAAGAPGTGGSGSSAVPILPRPSSRRTRAGPPPTCPRIRGSSSTSRCRS